MPEEREATSLEAQLEAQLHELRSILTRLEGLRSSNSKVSGLLRLILKALDEVEQGRG